MLSPSRDDEDDDRHLCIKCNATIIGLDNYVKHRKERCGKKFDSAIKATKAEIPALDSLEPSYSLGADVFFQSLELQSSVKKPSLSILTPPIPASTKSSQVLDRKQPLLAVASSSRDVPRMSPLESNMRGEDWIGGHSLRFSNSEGDNQTKLINAVASISGVAKKEISNRPYNIIAYNDFKAEEDSEEASDDSEEDDEEESHATGGKWKPPLHHTGGKWRPDSPDQEVWDIKEEHTSGKWKPLMVTETQEGDEDDEDAPPPGHTKGKWVPGAQDPKTQIMQTTIQTKSSVQYWCGPCNRRLGSRAIYEKHLMSNLHMRKILPENDLEFSGHMEPSRNLKEKRISRPSKYTDDLLYIQDKKRKKNVDAKEQKNQKKKRNRKPYYSRCFGCKSRVRVHLIGKHLISHYHFRKSCDTTSKLYGESILENMEAIIHQSPFQCSPCKFYTNWLSNFMQHWYSEDHEQKMASMEGRYWCSFCKFECDSSQDMLNHLSGSTHGEVVAVINRSMPIIIRKKTIFKCNTCSKEFRYNIEIKKHCQRTGHELTHTATDVYQEMHKCDHCKVKYRSSLTLAAHLKIKHKQKAYLCLVCSKSFKSSEEATKHRQTSEHRIRRKELLRERGVPTKDLSKKCPHCLDVVLKNILELKEHIEKVHPNERKKCPKCGMAFILSQEVTRHVRSNACQFEPPDAINSSTFWNCSQCLFTTNSQAECFFHEVLHTTPRTEIHKIGDKEKVVEKFDCPLCPKVFRKASLRHHIRQHTFERPFICSICGANFTRLNSLNNHSKAEHGSDVTKSAKVSKIDKTVGRIDDSATEEFRCKICNKRFTTESCLTLHNETPCEDVATKCYKTRQHKCPHNNCTYVAATLAQIIRHRKSHGERVKHHECPFCAFKTDQTSHMKRHMRCHEGTKPYACPHCPFVCGSLENLRKHAISSGRHVGLLLYTCPECSVFHTNRAAELRAHLTTQHAHKYNAKAAVEAVKLHLIRVPRPGDQDSECASPMKLDV